MVGPQPLSTHAGGPHRPAIIQPTPSPMIEITRALSMRRVRAALMVFSCILISASAIGFPNGEGAPISSNAHWKHGVWSDPAFFPIAVWLQDPRNAPKYKQ